MIKEVSYMRKFYKTIVTIEVLSELPLGDPDPEQIMKLNFYGEVSAIWNSDGGNEISPQQAAKELIGHGSDPSFFDLTEKGEELEPPNPDDRIEYEITDEGYEYLQKVYDPIGGGGGHGRSDLPAGLRGDD